VRYAFVAEHRPLFPVRTMCRCLRIHPSGFYAWLRNPLSKRAREDARQTELIRTAWKDSGKVYGYRKPHDDLLDQGETCCPNRVARLAGLAGIKARIGYRRLPGSYGGKPSVVVDNMLDRQFDVDEPDRAWVTDITYIRTQEGFYQDAGRLRLSGRRDRPLLPPRCRLVDAEPSDDGHRPAGIAYGGVAQEAEEQRADPFRSGLAVHQYGLGVIPQGAQLRAFHEPARELPRQRGPGELLQHAQAGTDTAKDLQDTRRGQAGRVRLHRDVL